MIISVLLMVSGILSIIYTEKVVNFTGKFEFAERWFGGGTYSFIKLMGLLIIILPFIYMVGGLDQLIAGTLGGIIPGGL